MGLPGWENVNTRCPVKFKFSTGVFNEIFGTFLY